MPLLLLSWGPFQGVSNKVDHRSRFDVDEGGYRH